MDFGFGDSSQNKSILNKLSFNPDLGSIASSNKQNTAHIYYEHRC